MAVLTPAQVAGIAAQDTPAGTTVAEWVQVAIDESSLRTDALSPTGCCRGLWQINVRAHADKITEARVSIANGHQAMKSPLRNWWVARLVYLESKSWRPWSAVKGAKPVVSARARQAAAAPDYSVVNSGGAVSGKPEEGVRAESITDLFSNPLDAAVGAIKAALDVVNAIGGWVSDPHNWQRVGYVVGGAALVIVAGAAIAGKAAESTPAGKVARAIR